MCAFAFIRDFRNKFRRVSLILVLALHECVRAYSVTKKGEKGKRAGEVHQVVSSGGRVTYVDEKQT